MAPSRTIAAIAALGALALVAAECPNACSGHGDCGKYDQCTCYRNWQGNDCSLRTCQFGVAHVDSPKGDLDGSNSVTGPDSTVVVKSQVYPMGTTEQFPSMLDTDGNELENSAHSYMECSNKGSCDRKTGSCSCFVGYEGVACQRASCNLNCNGHGVCKSIREIAQLDNSNTYELWDNDITMGCHCDEGWYGPDCTLRTCKRGTDPLYLDAPQTLRTTVWELNIAYPSASSSLSGNFSIRFFDRDGEDWFTDPIPAPNADFDEDATCVNILAALRTLPNKVVPSGTDDVTCDGSLTPVTTAAAVITDFVPATPVASGLAGAFLAKAEREKDTIVATVAPHSVYTFKLSFPGLAGVTKQPEVDYHVDSVHAPSMYSADDVYKYDVLSYWSHGNTIGEDIDYVSDLCQGVKVRVKVGVAEALSKLDLPDNKTEVASTDSEHFLELEVVDVNGNSLTEDEVKKLKACLGDADVDPDNNHETYNWDFGSDRSYVSPHLIKLVNTDGTEGGRHAMLSYVIDGLGVYHFVLLNDVPSGDSYTYYVYTTTGHLQSVHTPLHADIDADSDAINALKLLSPKDGFPSHIRALGYYGDRTLFTNSDASCEFSTNSSIDSLRAVASSMQDPFFKAGAYGGNGVYPCLSKGDIIYLARVANDYESATAYWGDAYAKNPNLNPYVIQRISVERFNGASIQRYTSSTADDDDTPDVSLANSATISLNPGYTATRDEDANRYRIVIDKSLATTTGAMTNKQGIIYHFTPPVRSSSSYYHHTAECANRGLCNTDLGLCSCFKGYTNDNCDTQSALAL